MGGTRGNPSYYIPSPLLADVLAPLIEEAGEDVVHEHADGTVEELRYGGIERLSQRVPTFLSDIQAKSVPRRIWAILNGDTMRTSTEIADALLMAADRMIEDTDLPTFPAHIGVAREMVEIHNERTDDPVEDVDDLAYHLIGFCKAFCIGLSLDAEEALELEAAKTVSQFLRKMTPKAESVAA